ncbi:AraC family transcriptional regulator [Vibrio sinensis]|uniref:AraC family transcriptional regulator n=1 Tax=Vibrio sinensis TaxID=2302434 RepID=A0A3A6RFT4_9VIBR|nr:AraC family transcriptional regulator [Vibrio sinensis]RJX75571.1 AraC family transcriptional regulator [Vibrio sinensis]
MKDSMENILEVFTRTQLNGSDGIKSLISWCYAYISNIDGVIDLASIVDDKETVLMLHVTSPISVTQGNDYLSLGAGVYVVGRDVISTVNINFNKDTQFLFVDLNMFNDFCVVPHPLGIHLANYQGFLDYIFNRLRDDIINENEIFGIINLSLVPAKVIKNEDYQRIVKSIELNFTNPNFSLDDVAESVYMSKRKVQKVLSQSGVTFMKILGRFRYKQLIYLIHTSSKVCYADEYIRNAGFPNYHAGNEYFKKVHHITVKKYIDKQRS